MCGIAGFAPSLPEEKLSLRSTVGRMTDMLRHRGPDGAGLWSDGGNGPCLGHRRLAIVDLTDTGRQPMTSDSGRFVVVFNGEIFNHRTLRRELEGLGRRFRGTSDTEVILAGTETWGLAACLSKCTGQFALALWDVESRRLYLARDRIGEKPLYVWRNPRGLAFASELRPLLMANRYRFEIDRDVLALYMRYGYVPDPLCIVKGSHKVRPGTIEDWRITENGIAHEPVVTKFWDLDQVNAAAPARPEEAVELLEAELRRAVDDQRVADVPVGAFLSGGVDSSVVTAIAQSLSSQPVRTYCVSFDDPTYDESGHARQVARHLGTEHTEIRLHTADLVGIVADLPGIYDEPFGDASQIPTVAVARSARQHVKVALSGDGGDELFGGYNRYYWPFRVARWSGRWPAGLRSWASSTMDFAGRWSPQWLLSAGQLAIGGRRGPIQDLRGKLRKVARLFDCRDPLDGYVALTQRWPAPELVVPDWSHADAGLARLEDLIKAHAALPAVTRWDIEHYLPGDNLVKIDRAAMSVGLETRAPLLDHRVCELAQALVRSFPAATFEASPKWPLKAVLARHVPRQLFERPKVGFSVPMASWLRGELHEWARGLLSAPGLTVDGLLDLRAARRMLDEHAAGREDHSAQLWPILTFIQWRARIER